MLLCLTAGDRQGRKKFWVKNMVMKKIVMAIFALILVSSLAFASHGARLQYTYGYPLDYPYGYQNDAYVFPTTDEVVRESVQFESPYGSGYPYGGYGAGSFGAGGYGTSGYGASGYGAAPYGGYGSSFAAPYVPYTGVYDNTYFSYGNFPVASTGGAERQLFGKQGECFNLDIVSEGVSVRAGETVPSTVWLKNFSDVPFYIDTVAASDNSASIDVKPSETLYAADAGARTAVELLVSGFPKATGEIGEAALSVTGHFPNGRVCRVLEEFLVNVTVEKPTLAMPRSVEGPKAEGRRFVAEPVVVVPEVHLKAFPSEVKVDGRGILPVTLANVKPVKTEFSVRLLGLPESVSVREVTGTLSANETKTVVLELLASKAETADLPAELELRYGAEAEKVARASVLVKLTKVMSVSLSTEQELVDASTGAFLVKAKVKNLTDVPQRGLVLAKVPTGWEVETVQKAVELEPNGEGEATLKIVPSEPETTGEKFAVVWRAADGSETVKEIEMGKEDLAGTAGSTALAVAGGTFKFGLVVLLALLVGFVLMELRIIKVSTEVPEEPYEKIGRALRGQTRLGRFVPAVVPAMAVAQKEAEVPEVKPKSVVDREAMIRQRIREVKERLKKRAEAKEPEKKKR